MSRDLVRLLVAAKPGRSGGLGKLWSELTLADPPVGGPRCRRCDRGAALKLDSGPICRRCLNYLVDFGDAMDIALQDFEVRGADPPRGPQSTIDLSRIQGGAIVYEPPDEPA